MPAENVNVLAVDTSTPTLASTTIHSVPVAAATTTISLSAATQSSTSTPADHYLAILALETALQSSDAAGSGSRSETEADVDSSGSEDVAITMTSGPIAAVAAPPTADPSGPAGDPDADTNVDVKLPIDNAGNAYIPLDESNISAKKGHTEDEDHTLAIEGVPTSTVSAVAITTYTSTTTSEPNPAGTDTRLAPSDPSHTGVASMHAEMDLEVPIKSEGPEDPAANTQAKMTTMTLTATGISASSSSTAATATASATHESSPSMAMMTSSSPTPADPIAILSDASASSPGAGADVPPLLRAGHSRRAFLA
jgi:hypothetical protein